MCAAAIIDSSLEQQGTCVNVAIWSIKPEIDMNTLLLGERVLKGDRVRAVRNSGWRVAMSLTSFDVQG